MKIELKENIVYESFENKKDMMEKILKMILDSKTDKIIYKGNPTEINYKMMKKVLLKDYTQRINPDVIKNMYNEIVESNSNRQFCIIYKNK
jgi:hypothetical protein